MKKLERCSTNPADYRDSNGEPLSTRAIYEFIPLEYDINDWFVLHNAPADEGDGWFADSVTRRKVIQITPETSNRLTPITSDDVEKSLVKKLEYFYEGSFERSRKGIK